MKILFRLFLIFFCINAYSLEIIRDPIFENYFKNLEIKYNLPAANVYIIKHNKINAFVLGNSIYFTTGMIKSLKEEDTLKSIYFHEIGHIYYNHYNSKKIKINSNKKNKIYNNLFSIGAVIFTGNPNIGIATNISIDQSILNSLSTNSIRFEIQADNFMLEKISENKVNTSSLIEFFDNLPENNNNFFKSHPSNKDRIMSLKKYSNFNKNKNSINFEWLKAKYGKKSNISKFNDFFSSLDKGIIDIDDVKLLININYIDYEIYKSGITINDIPQMFINLIQNNSNPYLKIEFYNMIIDNNMNKYFEVIEKNKHNNKIQSEYFFYFLYGKYYSKINNKNLSNFYFCQFYTMAKLKNKYNYYCNNYDIKDIPKIDNSYALLK